MHIYNPTALIHQDNPLVSLLTYSPVDALLAIELPRGEFLLVFHSLATYVDSQGHKSREKEIMYPALPTGASEYLTRGRNYIKYIL